MYNAKVYENKVLDMPLSKENGKSTTMKRASKQFAEDEAHRLTADFIKGKGAD
jgi:hypothetical protein